VAGLLSCPQGIAGGVIAFDYPGANPSLTTLIRIADADGRTSTAVLPPDVTAWTVPEEPNWRTVARDYIVLGFTHIWEGPDHLLFVAGLLLLARQPRRILLAVTGFTAAHSITLTLATLDLVRLPIPAVEAMIALSILFLAAELARDDATSFSRRAPVALSFVFGLLHGFGFASALGEIGLPTRELAVGLLSFNIGVELGQLAFIAAAGALVLFWKLMRRLAEPGGAAWVERRAGLIGAYALGVPSALWFFQRAAAAFGL
jgi:hydrogenase/urease accessory protein HupE